MNQYNLVYPENNKIYYGLNAKSVATKVFRNIAKNNNLDQSRIILEDNNSKKKHYFVGMTNKKLNSYTEIVNNYNPIQSGGSATTLESGSSKIDDKEFFRKLSELSGSINLSVDELVKILKTKYDPETESAQDEKNVVTLVNDGIDKLDTLNKTVSDISVDLSALRKEIAPAPLPSEIFIPSATNPEVNANVNDDSSEDNGGFCTIM